LSPAKLEVVQQECQAFLDSWKSHGDKMEGDVVILEDQFVILSLKEEQEISGCSIDSSVALFKSLKMNHGLDALDRGRVFYKDGSGKIKSCARPDFASLCRKGEIEMTTPVYNLMPTCCGELREQGGLELAFQDSWHQQAFKLASQV
jgi:hypothetical protein